MTLKPKNMPNESAVVSTPDIVKEAIRQGLLNLGHLTPGRRVSEIHPYRIRTPGGKELMGVKVTFAKNEK